MHLFKPRTLFGRKIFDNILKIKTIIGEPIYPDVPVQEGKSVSLESVQKMSDSAQSWMKEKVAEFYKEN